MKKGGYSKVKPVVVKHVLTDSYIQKPEIFQQRPDKQFSESRTNIRMTPSVSHASMPRSHIPPQPHRPQTFGDTPFSLQPAHTNAGVSIGGAAVAPTANYYSQPAYEQRPAPSPFGQPLPEQRTLDAEQPLSIIEQEKMPAFAQTHTAFQGLGQASQPSIGVLDSHMPSMVVGSGLNQGGYQMVSARKNSNFL